jgi:hypothetical protein
MGRAAMTSRPSSDEAGPPEAIDDQLCEPLIVFDEQQPHD